METECFSFGLFFELIVLDALADVWQRFKGQVTGFECQLHRAVGSIQDSGEMTFMPTIY